MSKTIWPNAQWEALVGRMRTALPEAFAGDAQVLNLAEGEWKYPGHPKAFLSPNDGTLLGHFPMLPVEAAQRAVRFAADEFAAWSRTDLDERRRRVAACVAGMREVRELLALLLAWEIGKPYAQALVSVDRCLSGVEWYLDNIEAMVDGRRPLGLISNIASWNYPLSVLVHAVLVQVLAGNTVIAKTPSDGGLYALTLAFGIARRAGLPVSLVSGSGGQLGEALVRSPRVAGLAFVGGKTNGRSIAAGLDKSGKRYMLEMEGVNAWGVWNFSDWELLAGQIKKGFEYGKQRCTAYPRYVVERRLFPQFLEMYLPVLASLRFGHPLLVDAPDAQAPPALDFGPLINSVKVEELSAMRSEALGGGAVSLYEGRLDESRFLPSQDVSAYAAPAALLGVPPNCALYHNEPFGPVDTIVVVDTLEQLISEMNVSNGSLVASVACDDPQVAAQVCTELRAFKTGINRVRSRGDRDEPFGGMGSSWRGCFVGGKYLVEAVTDGALTARLYGNFPDYSWLPEDR